MLVGGTALAGFYAAHRRSDDLDLFVRHEQAFRATVIAVRSLSEIGATFSDEYSSKGFFHTNVTLDGHDFTVDVVVDENLFKVGQCYEVQGVSVVDLRTLTAMKAATLVSRCSEKDLYDLLWILNESQQTLSELLKLGHTIDAGLNEESVLLSLTTATLREEACDFSLDPSITGKMINKQVNDFRDALKIELTNHLEGKPLHPLGVLVGRIKKWRSKQ